MKKLPEGEAGGYSGQTSKKSRYFKYAIGEILLVVIGILIALQINTWNDNQKNRQYELTMLSEVEKKLKIDQQIIKNWIPNLNKVIHSIHEIVEIKNDPTYPRDSLKTHLEVINRYGIAISFNNSVYDGLKSGGLNNISDPKIRNLLTEIYGNSMP